MIDQIISKIKRDGLISFLVAIMNLPFTIKRRIEYRKMLCEDTLGGRFALIYEKNLWGSDESASGEGSELDYTENLRNWLSTAVPRYGVKRFVDAPCGDFNWMRYLLPSLDIQYVGLDIVESVVRRNVKNYANEKVEFFVANICEDVIPACDFLMVRDCLFHLSYKDIDRFLQNIAGVDYKYLLTTTHLVDGDFLNSNIRTGDFRRINLFEKPFNFSRADVVEFVDDYPPGHLIPRQLILISKVNVPKSLGDF